MRAIDLDMDLPDDPAKEAGRCNRDGMGHPGSWRDLAVRQRVLRLGSNVLKEGAPERHIHGLHPPANSQGGQTGPHRDFDDIQFKVRPSTRHDLEGIALAFSIQGRGEVWAAAGEKEAVEIGQQPTPGPSVGYKGKNKGQTTQFFDRSDISRAQEIRRFLAAHIFAVAGVEIRCDPYDGSHVIGWVPVAPAQAPGKMNRANRVLALLERPGTGRACPPSSDQG